MNYSKEILSQKSDADVAALQNFLFDTLETLEDNDAGASDHAYACRECLEVLHHEMIRRINQIFKF
jgi:hypothetical protein